jgi:eukaryotic-like serine/threonine-protein kinase
MITVGRPGSRSERVDEPPAGTVVAGRYELVEIAGRGGMANVWRAQVRGDAGFSRTVAVKQMHAHLAEQRGYVDMFIEEARVCALLQSPNIAEVYDFVAQDGNYYLVMEWIEGIDLGSYVRFFSERGQQVEWEMVTAIGVGILRALAAAHERADADGQLMPVVHRDVSPHNVLLTTRGMVKLIDFGLSLTDDRRGEVTEPGVVKGKMSYLAPEIVAGQRPTPETDQFATGSVLWEALVGRKLFDGATDYETYTRLRECAVQPLRPYRPDVPAPLVQLINRALAARPEQRFPSTREMARQMGTVLKKVRMRRDLHAVLARTVIETRASMGLGRRTGDPTSTTPIADIMADMAPAPVAEAEEKGGLRYRLPFFGRKRS